MPEGGPVKADQSRGMDALSEKVNRLEERAVRLANEEMEQVQRGRALTASWTGSGAPFTSAPMQAAHSAGSARPQWRARDQRVC